MSSVLSIPLKHVVTRQTLTDRLGRPLRDLRLSVIDRCNLRCSYCMPADSLPGQGVFLPRKSLLADAELETLVRVFVDLGVHKVRLTGGEPLLRRGIVDLTARIANVPGIDDLAMTTNGIYLPKYADGLFKAGLSRLTISLDSLDEEVYKRSSGGLGSVNEVLQGIKAAEAAGFQNIKINTVIQRGVNDDGVLDMVEHFRGSGHILRFIEFMDVGTSNHWSRDQVVDSADVHAAINSKWPLEPLAATEPGETARRYRFADGVGEIGFISSITQPFCGNCSRARVTADGNFYSCLFTSKGSLLRPLLRQSPNGETVKDYLAKLWAQRGDRYSELRRQGASASKRVEMYRMGG